MVTIIIIIILMLIIILTLFIRFEMIHLHAFDVQSLIYCLYVHSERRRYCDARRLCVCVCVSVCLSAELRVATAGEATENARPVKCRTWKMTDQIAGLENAGPNNFTS